MKCLGSCVDYCRISVLADELQLELPRSSLNRDKHH